ncbi:MAG: tRNA (adenosine(37)-N6)-dimethylallyltransferase MiaA [Crocinitomicaceae bacterium]|nr:tRNA (adenosine(37)-N6)-dimethylallyltransferase MiaA [Crocinitomicaceae bacterium]
MLDTKYLIVIVGPTAVGKTSLSIEIAKFLKCEIISADSRQFYKEITIGTAKPSESELAQVSHHFINNISIYDKYSAGQFEKEALICIDQLFKKYKYAVVVGGSGMYIDAICKGIDDIPSDCQIRNKLNEQYKETGIESLQKELKQKDPIHFSNMDIQNPQRLIRALEVCRVSGKPYSSFRTMKSKKRDFSLVKIGLNMEKDILYKRINNRVDRMISNGLLKEIDSIKEHKNINALNTVGYKELFNYKNKLCSFDQAINDIKKNTRRFAKRQMTWFKKDTSITWFKPNDFQLVMNHILKKTT